MHGSSNLNKNTGRKNLTYREKEISKLRIQGYTRKEIADILNISHFTVKKHLENIYKKLGIASVVELIKLVYREK
ncbi:LuxR family transcriptional regulator [Desulfitobacterium sp. LBE]|uniref:HTH luxR-type domain-containing protein n=5 Tax=root TaxID=1 RepID=Q24VQ7_DESHY|nr:MULTISPECIES: LuxR C-terminal-related transcriptional regulator [Desulfitobacterium]ACL21284.1 transcriptional regulator, LuxR family [Desulfitobacterium hafniense DCB-2]EHL06668.1 transcriptional regulator, LuxR family [Desulfitobacterium hafniense DP7]KTE92672.1 helix-turn-helix transcriptional regulator [Desulfitobacterium hafniense]MEA5023022.1 LuxR C-terminal-related transcriptional regulator [Desulfitobacterium hafniense]TWH55884.1 LuxR family transcriptional regulator [Desulfitobacte